MLQLVLHPVLTAGLQSAAYPSPGLTYPSPSRQGTASDLYPLTSFSMGAMPSGSTPMGSMPMGSMAMPPMPYAPWLSGAWPMTSSPAMNGPVYVPPSLVSSLLQPQGQGQAVQGQAAQGSSLAAGALAALEQAIAPYTAPYTGIASSSSSTGASASGVLTSSPADEVSERTGCPEIEVCPQWALPNNQHRSSKTLRFRAKLNLGDSTPGF